jgi:acyl-coenzyme A synthetase/AMP-(fatty) acid ligase
MQAFAFADSVFMIDGDIHYSRQHIWQAAQRLAQSWSVAPTIINLYEDRLHFTLVLMACAMKGGVCILPPDRAPHTITEIMQCCGEAVKLVGDAPLAGLLKAPLLAQAADWDNLLASALVDEGGRIDLAALDASEIWLYTSGTTGAPKRVVKSWHQLRVMAEKAIARFAFDASVRLLVTVPCQHMYGLEAGVFWPWFSGAKILRSRPFYPADLAPLLQADGEACVLVSTPFHLKMFSAMDAPYPLISRVISATAPMPPALALRLKQVLAHQVCEVLGSTETASYASRCVGDADFSPWRLYEGYQLVVSARSAVMRIAPLNETYELADEINCLDHQQFYLLGRRKDMIKLAGKRQSLARLNAMLLQCVEDGVFVPSRAGERLEAVVVSKDGAMAIRACLQQYMDAVFLPRHIYFVERLPRNTLGKLPRARLEDLMAQLRAKQGDKSNDLG